MVIIKFRPRFLCVPRGLVVKFTPGASKVLSSIPDGTFSCSLLLFSFLRFFFFFSFSFHFRHNGFCYVSIYNFQINKFSSRLYLPLPRSPSRGPHAIYVFLVKVYIFIPLIHSAPFLRFSHILLTPIFSDVYYHAECFSYPWWCRWSAKARNLILIFNFSSQRLHLNYILLSNSNVCSFEFP